MFVAFFILITLIDKPFNCIFFNNYILEQGKHHLMVHNHQSKFHQRWNHKKGNERWNIIDLCIEDNIILYYIQLKIHYHKLKYHCLHYHLMYFLNVWSCIVSEFNYSLTFWYTWIKKAKLRNWYYKHFYYRN